MVDRAALTNHLLAVAKLGVGDDIIPVSAVDDYQVEELADLLVGLLPEGPRLYPEGELTDEPELDQADLDATIDTDISTDV